MVGDISILTTIKKMLGVTAEYDAFDTSIIVNINTVLMTLSQLGVGAPDFLISDESATWTDFLGESKILEGVKTYIYIQTKLLFDPPTVASLLQALKEQAAMLEWRLIVQTEGTVNVSATT